MNTKHLKDCLAYLRPSINVTYYYQHRESLKPSLCLRAWELQQRLLEYLHCLILRSFFHHTLNKFGIYFEWYSLGLVLFSLVQNDLSVFNMRVWPDHLKLDHPLSYLVGGNMANGGSLLLCWGYCSVVETWLWYLPGKSWQCSHHVPNSRFDLQHRNKYMLRSRTIILCNIFFK